MRALETAVCLESIARRQRHGVLQQRRLPAVEKQAVYRRAEGEKDVIVLSVKGNCVTEDGRILGDKDQRIRDVRVGPDGYLYDADYERRTGSFGKSARPGRNQVTGIITTLRYAGRSLSCWIQRSR